MSSALLIHYITQYGYLSLYGILLVSILGLPIPDEFLLMYVGFLSFSGQLNSVFAVLAAAGGSMTGITVAYFLGRFFEAKVLAFLKRHAGGKRLQTVLDWYQKHGGKLLTAGYFIPGVRHLSGYVAGLSRLGYKEFAFYAYLGALAWTSLFIGLGRTLGSRWKIFLPVIHRYSLLLGVTAVIFFLAFYLVYKYHERIGAWFAGQFLNLPSRYQSLGKQRFIVAVGGIVFLGLFIFLMGLIQDFVAQDVAEFDKLIAFGLEFTSPPWVMHLMLQISALSTHLVIFSIFLVAVYSQWLVTKHWSHVLPLVMAWGGGTFIDYLFRLIFRGETVYFFENVVPFQTPNAGFLLASLSFYSVLAYLIGRGRTWLPQLFLLIGVLLLLLMIGLSPVFLHVHTPSEMVTALTVSGLWALLCVFVYEFRLYRLSVIRKL
jgi:membrane protein DedA with SNARE-associated domain